MRQRYGRTGRRRLVSRCWRHVQAIERGRSVPNVLKYGGGQLIRSATFPERCVAAGAAGATKKIKKVNSAHQASRAAAQP